MVPVRRVDAAAVSSCVAAWYIARRGMTVADVAGIVVAGVLAWSTFRRARNLPAFDWIAVVACVAAGTVLVLTGWPGTATELVGVPKRLADLRCCALARDVERV